jgi:diguanylate cyclase (GGDEF)-like protein/PAS domain S-box-containing protein
MGKNRRQDHALRQAVNGLHNLLIQNTETPSVRFCECFTRAVTQLCGAASGVLFVPDERPAMWISVAGWVNGDYQLPQTLRNGLVSITRWIPLPEKPSVWYPEQINLLSECTRGAIDAAKHGVYSFPIYGEQQQILAVLLLWGDACSPYNMPLSLEGLAEKIQRLQPLTRTFARLLTPSVCANLTANMFFENHSLWFRRILEGAFEGILILDDSDCVLFTNSALCLMLRVKDSPSVGKPLDQLVSGPVYQVLEKLIGARRAAAAPDHQQVTLTFPSADLPDKTLRVRVNEMDIGSRACRTLQFWPVRSAMMQRVNDQIGEGRLGNLPLCNEALTRMAPVGIMQVDAQWNCMFVNDQLCDFTGMQPEEFYGIRWFDVIHHDEVGRVLEAIRTRLSQGLMYEGQYRLCSPLGVATGVKCRVKGLYSSVHLFDGFIATFTDISDQLRLESSLRKISETDTLTGLMNRRHFMDHAQSLLCSRRDTGNFALLYIDLDGFKQVNDTLGHDRGDLLLKEAAQRLKGCLRATDAVARIGGDEFIVLMQVSNQQNEEMIQIAQQLIDMMAKAFSLADQQVYISASIGVAVTSYGDDKSLDQIIKEADLALYHAKGSGRNNCQIFSDKLRVIYSRQAKLKSSLQNALDGRQFFLMFQPQVRAQGGDLFTIEALLRWEHPELGRIEPSEFIPILEETGFIHAVGLWVFRQACQCWSEWVHEGILDATVGIAINVSPIQMRSKQFVSDCAQIIERAQVPAHSITLEITESTLLEDIARAVKTLEQLRQLGVRVALDDFGAGYTSLSYLNRYPIDIIKIDKGFVSRCNSRRQEMIICKAIIELAHDLNLSVIGEGVEFEACFRLLQQLRCDVIQGNFVISATEAAECARWLKDYVAKQAKMGWQACLGLTNVSGHQEECSNPADMRGLAQVPTRVRDTEKLGKIAD